MYPSIKTIELRLFEVLEHEHGEARPAARMVRKIMEADDRKWLIDTFNSVANQDRWSYHPHDLVTLKMAALTEWLDGYGVEAIADPDDFRRPAAEYVNLGDTYLTTVIYDHRKQRFEITSWGDWLERAEERGFKGGEGR